VANSWLFAWGALASAFSIGCGHGGSDPAPTLPADASGRGGASSSPALGAGGSAGGASLPPEKENESQYLAPVATGKYLWSANPLSGRVALIDATTLSVALGSAGNRPTQVLGLEASDQYGALVLNQGSHDATLLRVDATGAPIKAKSFRTQSDANAWAASPQGHYAIAWSDAAQVSNVGPLDLFQDLTVFSLTSGAETSVRLSVGARPSRFAFDHGETHAYAVTQEGISVIDLGDTPSVSAVLPLSSDPLGQLSASDVSFAPDGSYAVVRSQGSSKVLVLALPSGEREEVDLGGVVTDLDLTSDGTRAFAVLGPKSEVVEVPIPIAGANPSTFARADLAGEAIGAIALNTDGSAALVYSTVLGTSRVVLLDLRSGATFLTHRSQDLISPVTALFAAPDPRFAISFQSVPAGSKKLGAFSLLSMQGQRVPKIVGTDAAPTQIAFSADGHSALVTVRSDSVGAFGAYLIGLENQQVDFIALQSPPVAAGVVVAANRAYVAQSHPEGRITFVSLADGGLETLTGFELAARILQ
jgi:DNA-binding beta-propeller fold protein YncE